jgi:hypothetical protein
VSLTDKDIALTLITHETVEKRRNNSRLFFLFYLIRCLLHLVLNRHIRANLDLSGLYR